MSGLTNNGLSPRECRSREKTARRTGRWPEWRAHPLGPGTCGAGWAAEFHTAHENGVFCVLVRNVVSPWGLVRHAMIRTVSNDEVRWAEKQRIKNEIFGEEALAVEVFPSQSRLVDQADAYHLWVLPEGVSLPFGIHRNDTRPITGD